MRTEYKRVHAASGGPGNDESLLLPLHLMAIRVKVSAAIVMEMKIDFALSGLSHGWMYSINLMCELDVQKRLNETFILGL